MKILSKIKKYNILLYSVTTIGWGVFSNNQLTNVEIGSSIQYMGRSAFSGNNNLKNITFTSKTCSEIENIQESSDDTDKYFPWISDFNYYKTKIIGTDGECSY